MDTVFWILLTGAAAIAGLLSWVVSQSRMKVAIAKEREALAEARGTLEAQRQAMEEAVRGAEEAGRRKALDEFISDVRVEQRHYIREHKVLFMHRRILVLEERIFFRNLPLSNWIEHQILLEEGADIDNMVRSLSVFERSVLSIDQGARLRRVP